MLPLNGTRGTVPTAATWAAVGAAMETAACEEEAEETATCEEEAKETDGSAVDDVDLEFRLADRLLQIRPRLLMCVS